MTATTARTRATYRRTRTLTDVARQVLAARQQRQANRGARRAEIRRNLATHVRGPAYVLDLGSK